MQLKCHYGGTMFAHALWLDLGFCCESLGDQGKSSILKYASCRLIYVDLPSGGPHVPQSFPPCYKYCFVVVVVFFYLNGNVLLCRETDVTAVLF
jgi:hypothetical protein